MVDWGSVNWSGVLPVLSVALGWLLNEFGSALRLRREDRRAIGRLLSDLLVIRREVLAMQAAAKMIRELPYSPREHLFFQLILAQLSPPDAGFQARFDESVKSVMGVKPLLGFDLVQQSQRLILLERLKQVAAVSDESADAWAEMGPLIEGTSDLDDLINDLAWLHGWRTWLEVRRHTRKPLRELPENLVGLLKAEAEKRTSAAPDRKTENKKT